MVRLNVAIILVVFVSFMGCGKGTSETDIDIDALTATLPDPNRIICTGISDTCPPRCIISHAIPPSEDEPVAIHDVNPCVRAYAPTICKHAQAQNCIFFSEACLSD